MIDPTNITNYNLSYHGLEEHILFWVCAAGKNGKTAARCLDNLLNAWRPFSSLYEPNPSPFRIIRDIDLASDDYLVSGIPEQLRRHGIGCYNNKAKTFQALVYSNIDLHTCSLDDLEAIHGIGPKTARCFLMHSRKGARVAGLDRHVLRFLREKGIDAPEATPTGKKYKVLEKEFLRLCDEAGKEPAVYDLEIWNSSIT